MPNIREYTNTIDSLRTSGEGAAAIARGGNAMAAAGERAARAGEDAARAGGNISRMLSATGRSIASNFDTAGRVAGQLYEAHVVQPEISKGATALVGLTNELDLSLNESMKGDLNDGTLGPRWRESVFQPQVEKYLDNFQTKEGRKWAEDRVNRLTSHYNDRITALSAMRAGAAVQQNLYSIGNNAAAIIDRDPSNFDFMLETTTEAIRTMVANSPNLSPEQKAKAETDLVTKMQNTLAETAIKSIARDNPERAEQMIAAGRFDKALAGQDRSQMMTYIRGQRTILRQEDRLQRVERDRQRKEAGQAALTKIMAEQFVVNEATGKLDVLPGTYKRIQKEMPQFGDPSLVNAALSATRQVMHEAERQVPVVTDPTTYDEFQKRMLLPEDDPNRLTTQEVYEAKAGKKLSNEHFSMYLNWTMLEHRDPVARSDEKMTQRFLSEWKPVITTSSYFKVDSKGDQMYALFASDVRKLMKEGRKAGRKPEETLELARRIVPYYGIGKPDPRALNNKLDGSITLYERPQVPVDPSVPPGQTDSFKDRFDATIPEDKRYKPGESVEDYARRLRGQ